MPCVSKRARCSRDLGQRPDVGRRPSRQQLRLHPLRTSDPILLCSAECIAGWRGRLIAKQEKKRGTCRAAAQGLVEAASANLSLCDVCRRAVFLFAEAIRIWLNRRCSNRPSPDHIPAHSLRLQVPAVGGSNSAAHVSSSRRIPSRLIDPHSPVCCHAMQHIHFSEAFSKKAHHLLVLQVDHRAERPAAAQSQGSATLRRPLCGAASCPPGEGLSPAASPRWALARSTLQRCNQRDWRVMQDAPHTTEDMPQTWQ